MNWCIAHSNLLFHCFAVSQDSSRVNGCKCGDTVVKLYMKVSGRTSSFLKDLLIFIIFRKCGRLHIFSCDPITAWYELKDLLKL